MARMIPSILDPNTKSDGEKLVFTRLRDEPGSADWTVLHSVDIAHHERAISGEVDFIVVVPGLGVLCLEVKAARSVTRGENGMWYLGRSRPEARGPFKQASEGMHSIRAHLSKSAPITTGVLFWSAVIFTHTSFEVESNEWHPWQVIDATALRQRPLSGSIIAILNSGREEVKRAHTGQWFDPTRERPTGDEADLIARVLRPHFEFFETPKQRRERTLGELKNYTDEQFEAIDYSASNDRIIFQGPAGTGKTILALETARRASLSGKKTLLLCFNRMLAKKLRSEAGEIQGLRITTLHRLMLDVAQIQPPQQASAHFWIETLPDLAISALLDEDFHSWQFDELVIDEAQDVLRDSYLNFIDGITEGGLGGGHWSLFGDFEKQALYTASSLPVADFRSNRAPDAALMNLRINCRNTPRMAALTVLLGGLDPDYSRVRRADDQREPLLMYFKDEADQAELLVATLKDLYSEGYRGSDIVILSPRAGHPAALTVNSSPWRDRIKPLEHARQGDIPFSTVHSFKGLEAAVVIATDIDEIAGEQDQAILYVALTRALERLILFVDVAKKSHVIQTLMKGG